MVSGLVSLPRFNIVKARGSSSEARGFLVEGPLKAFLWFRVQGSGFSETASGLCPGKKVGLQTD